MTKSNMKSLLVVVVGVLVANTLSNKVQAVRRITG